MKALISFSVAALILAGALAATMLGREESAPAATRSAAKIYVALEGEGSVAVLDPSGARISTISLSDDTSDVMYMPHNIDAARDGGLIWVTGNAMRGMKHSFRLVETAYADDGHEDGETMSDQLIAIDPATDTIVRRIPIGIDQHLAHVVTSSDGASVYASAQEQDVIYVVDRATMTIRERITLPEGSGSHGMRISPDDRTLYVALNAGRALGIVDTETTAVRLVPLDGAAVQTAVAPDGSWAAVSVYDSRSVAFYDPTTEAPTYVRLPEGSQGAVQLYPTPDSRFLYVADQGLLDGRPAGSSVYVIDAAAHEVVATIPAGEAPHGVALDRDGMRAYVTNLSGGTVSVIDTAQRTELAQVRVGAKPNGVTVWEGTTVTKADGALAHARMTVYKSPTCGCCGNYIAELKRHGADVTVEELDDAALDAKKRTLGVSKDLESCHTTTMDGYVIEGHVPIEALVKLRTERPSIAGIALPGMPAGSPGMSGMKAGPFLVLSLDHSLFGEY